MYNPSALTSDVWAKYTRALTDCNSKTVDVRGGGSPFSTSQVYEYVMDPKGNDIHHYILQYLEEGSIDLVIIYLKYTNPILIRIILYLIDRI